MLWRNPWYNIPVSRKFITADHHFFHEAIIRLCNRPFADVAAMNEALVQRWNSVVAPNDLVYYGGDMFYRGRTEECRAILDCLHGQIHFVEGNHDKKLARKFRDRFLSYGDRLEIKHEGRLIVLDHYAMRVWRNSGKGSWSLYGHSHGNLPEDPNLLSFDIGVDCWDFYPVSMEQVVEKMQRKIAAQQASAGGASSTPSPLLLD